MSTITGWLICVFITVLSMAIVYEILDRRRYRNTYTMGPVRVKATRNQYERYLKVQHSIESRLMQDPDTFDSYALKETIMSSDPKDTVAFLKFYRRWARYRRRHGTPFNPATRFTLEEIKY